MLCKTGRICAEVWPETQHVGEHETKSPWIQGTPELHVTGQANSIDEACILDEAGGWRGGIVGIVPRGWAWLEASTDVARMEHQAASRYEGGGRRGKEGEGEGRRGKEGGGALLERAVPPLLGVWERGSLCDWRRGGARLCAPLHGRRCCVRRGPGSVCIPRNVTSKCVPGESLHCSRLLWRMNASESSLPILPKVPSFLPSTSRFMRLLPQATTVMHMQMARLSASHVFSQTQAALG